jgi:HlyD family secretion protein
MAPGRQNRLGSRGMNERQVAAVGTAGSGSRRWWVLVAAVVLLLGVAVLVRAGRHRDAISAAAPQDSTPLVTAITPEVRDVAAVVAVTGAISARNDMPIGPEGDGGRVAAVYVEAGDHVRAGQVLALLDPSVVASQVAAAAAARDELKAAVDSAEAEFHRAESARSAFSVEDLERRRTAAMTARARVNVAEAQLAEAQARLTRTRIVAPSDGIVLTRTAEVGQVAMPSGVLFRMARNGEIEMRAVVAEQDMPRLRIGQDARVYLSGVARPFLGKVWQLGAVIDPATRQGSVRIALPPPEADLRPGAFARGEIAVDTMRGAVVPQTAVLADGAGNFVLAIGADNALQRRAITLGGADRDGLLVLAGLQPGERIVAAAGAFLHEGERVVVAPPAASEGSAAAGGGGAARSVATHVSSATP